MFKFIFRHKWVFIVSFFLYGLWVLYWLMCANVIFKGLSFFDIHFPTRINPTDFTVSHAASALDSLIFFVTVSFVLTVISIRKPEEEKLHRKIEYIFEGADSKSKLGQYLANEVSSLACISALTDRTITFKEIDLDARAVKVSANTDVQIKNIHNNHQYATDEMTYKIKPDNVPNAEGVFGEVHDISMIFDASQPERNKKIIDCTEVIDSADSGFEKLFDLKLKPQEQVIYRTNAWIWQDLKAPLKLKSPRFTEKQIITLKNQTNTSITFNAILPSLKKKEVSEEVSQENFTLEPKSSKTIELLDTTPNDIPIFTMKVSQD